MAFPTTANGWISYVRNWIGADEYSDAQIGNFLDLAQNRLNREMASYGMEAMDEVVITEGAPSLDLLEKMPSFGKIRLVNVQGTTHGPLDVVAINEMKTLQAKDMHVEHEPCYYAIDAGRLYIYPFPAIGAVVEVYHYQKQQLMQSGVLEYNVFSKMYPDALLHAACLEAAPYMVEDERIPIWENKYVVALSTANDEGKQIKLGSTPLQRRFRVA